MALIGTDTAWQAELACAAAWPSDRNERIGAWLCHESAGRSRRINSASPAAPDAALDCATIAAVEAAYPRGDRTPLFRVPAFLSAADRALDEAGYGRPEGATRTLCASLPTAPSWNSLTVMLHASPTPTWLAMRQRLAGHDHAEAQAEQHRLRTLTGHCAFALAGDRDGPSAIGYAYRWAGWIVLEAIATDSARRGQGWARAVVSALLMWGQQGGASTACLQVLIGNDPAGRLYAGLRFTAELYRYHYRQPSRTGREKFVRSRG